MAIITNKANGSLEIDSTLHAGGTITNFRPDYTVASTTFSLHTLTGTAVDAGLTDVGGWSSEFTLPFTFTFYGIDYTKATVNANGFLRLGSFLDALQSRSLAQQPKLAPYRIIIDPSLGGTIKYETFGTTPNQIFVVEWKDVFEVDSLVSNISMQLKLFEVDNTIEFHVEKASSDQSPQREAFQGLTHPYNYTQEFFAEARVDAVFNLTNDAVKFTPAAASTIAHTETGLATENLIANGDAVINGKVNLNNRSVVSYVQSDNQVFDQAQTTALTANITWAGLSATFITEPDYEPLNHVALRTSASNTIGSGNLYDGLMGITNKVTHQSAGSIDRLKGLESYVYQTDSAGSISEMTGLFSDIATKGTSIGTAQGIYNRVSSTGPSIGVVIGQDTYVECFSPTVDNNEVTGHRIQVATEFNVAIATGTSLGLSIAEPLVFGITGNYSSITCTGADGDIILNNGLISISSGNTISGSVKGYYLDIDSTNNPITGNAIGAENRLRISSVTGSAYGQKLYVNVIGTSPTLYGQDITVEVPTGGVATNVYGERVNITRTGSPGTVTNFYGLYLEDVSGATTLNYAIYTNAGKVRFGDHLELTNTGTASELRLYEPSAGGSFYTGFKAGDLSANVIYQLPLADGSSGHVLTTDGSGNLSWAAASGGTVDGSGAANRVTYWSDADTLTSTSGFEFSSNQLRIGTSTANTKMTQGITINQGAGDNEALALASTDVAHGFTDLADASTYASFSKNSATGGGLVIEGWATTAEGIALTLRGSSALASPDTTHSTAGTGYIHLTANTISAATRATITTTGANLVCIRSGTSGSTTQAIIDAQGNYYQNGANWTEYDAYDDSQLVDAIDKTLSKTLRQQMVDDSSAWLAENEALLEEAGIVEFNKDSDGVPFVNTSALMRLHNGTLRQQAKKIDKLTELLGAALDRLARMEVFLPAEARLLVEGA